MCCAGVFDSKWFWKQREQTLDGDFVSFTRYNGDIVVDNNVLLTKCDTTATNGVVHTADSVLPSALRLYAPNQNRGLLHDLGYIANKHRDVFHHFDRHLDSMWENMRDWDWDMKLDWEFKKKK